jgi:hypothetical protein
MSLTKQVASEKLTTKSKTLINETVTNFTDKQIKAIADASYKIRSINNKKSETRKEFVTVFEKHHDTYRWITKTFDELAAVALGNGDTKKYVLAYYIQLIRKRQENMGINAYLINEVKYGFMKSIAKWIDTPGDLQKSGTKKENEEEAIKSSKKKTTKASKP